METSGRPVRIAAEFRYEGALPVIVSLVEDRLTLDCIGGERILIGRDGREVSRTAHPEPFTLSAQVSPDPAHRSRLRAMLDACAVMAEPVTVRGWLPEGGEDGPAHWEISVCRTGQVMHLR